MDSRLKMGVQPLAPFFIEFNQLRVSIQRISLGCTLPLWNHLMTHFLQNRLLPYTDPVTLFKFSCLTTHPLVHVDSFIMIVFLPQENLIIKTRTLCSGNRSQLLDSSQNSENQFKMKYCFLIKTDKGNVIKFTKLL